MSKQINNSVPVITVDGPVGSGKGTIASLLADKLNWNMLESGALYRGLAWMAMRDKINLPDVAGLVAMAKQINLKFVLQNNQLQVWLADLEITDQLRSEDCARLSSKIAAILPIRQALLAKQREYRVLPGLIADGRDMGTVVFPDAQLKFYLDASLEARVARRYSQLQNKGINVNLAQLKQEIIERDARDKQRTHSPLFPAKDAMVIDTTDLTVEQVFNKILQILVPANI